MRRPRRPDIDADDLIRDAARGLDPTTRRAFLKSAAGLGSLVMLTGCDLSDSRSAETVLSTMSRFNDRVQALLFNPDKLAPEYPAEMITRPFPFNGFYRADQAPVVNGADWRLELAGKIAEARPWTLAELNALPHFTQITRHICVEGWSAIGSWTGVRFSDFLQRVGADLRAPYVTLRCADGYFTSIDMATALHPQTQMSFAFAGETLPRIYGFPMKLRMPTKLGFKNPKHVVSIEVTDRYDGGYWENEGYNWFSGL
ncbi:molybdopterin-dependent oxidoreductase [Terrihabitans sp. B22-R8]|uniref:molybdopterin-dependent oxidoreductase n=1 Tax=Terrihabitans sp. B22-R8 TaxID=3425128 RepID=UPI00403CF734